jgi:hypothetical protein
VAAAILIDGGMGYHRHHESSIGISSGVTVAVARPADPYKETHIVAVSGQVRGDGTRDFRLAFPTPGTYRVKLQYRDVESNELVLTARAAEGDDAKLFAEHLKPRPELLTEWSTLEDDDVSALGALLEAYKGSRYLYRPQLLYWKRKLKEASWAFGATGGLARGENPLDADVGTVLAEIEGTDWSGSAFDDDRLMLIAEMREQWGGGAAAVATYRRIVEKYPDTPVGKYARASLALLGDQTPPVLALSVVPATLWPPNHKLEPITVAVSVTDNADSNPSVKLVSISCDDGCSLVEDVAGAALDTYDRTFELRSERRGFGSGRTYTITYEASDAAGNKATATATVTVPHDQGVAKKK